MSNHNWVNELKEKADIVRIIGSYVDLRQKGRNFWACCPFHSEKTPSFSVNQEQQFFHCFGCGKSGDVIYFLQEHLTLDFIEAANLLAERVGFKIPEKSYDRGYLKNRELIKKICDINRLAADFYFNNLKDSRSSYYLNYLRGRKLSDKTIVNFGIGCSLSSEELFKYLAKHGYDEKTMIEAGLVTLNTKRDFFTERIIFPIIDYTGNVLGFGGRAIHGDSPAKYINTATTKAFDKRKELYAMNMLAKLRGKQEKISSIVLVEGYMDVIALSQAGITNVVASMGTSLTKEQCMLLKKRNIENVYVCFDGDSAGESATLRSLQLLSEVGLEVKVMTVPNNLDPDEYVEKFGKEGFIKLMEISLPIIEYILTSLSKKHDLSSLVGRSKFVSAAVPVLAKMNEADQNIYSELVSKISKVEKQAILDTLRRFIDKETSNIKAPEKTSANIDPKSTFIISSKRNILAACFLNSDESIFSSIQEAYFGENTVHSEIFSYCLKKYEAKKNPKIGDLISLSEEHKNEMLEIEGVMRNLNAKDYKEILGKSIREVTLNYLLEARNTLLKGLLSAEDVKQRDAINLKLKDIALKLKELK